MTWHKVHCTVCFNKNVPIQTRVHYVIKTITRITFSTCIKFTSLPMYCSNFSSKYPIMFEFLQLKVGDPKFSVCNQREIQGDKMNFKKYLNDPIKHIQPLQIMFSLTIMMNDQYGSRWYYHGSSNWTHFFALTNNR